MVLLTTGCHWSCRRTSGPEWESAIAYCACRATTYFDDDWIDSLCTDEQRSRSEKTPHIDSCTVRVSKMFDGVGKSLVLRRRDLRSRRVWSVF
jgi:hypothetical protein